VSVPFRLCLIALVLAASGSARAAAAPGQHGPDVAGKVIVWRGSGGVVKVAGSNALYDLGSHNVIRGGGGDNDIYPGPGDDIHGGAGRDAVIFAGTSAPVTVTLDNEPNDGAAGNHDNVRSDVEELYGGSGRSTLIGDLAPHAPPELIWGGSGDNTIVGGSGPNRIYGGPGANTINAFNGQSDVIICGSGASTVTADAADVLVGCTHRRPAPRVQSTVDYTLRFLASPPVTLVSQLSVQAIPADGRVEVLCHGGGCPFAHRAPNIRGARHLDLAPLFAGARLAAGTQLAVLITKRNVVLRNAIGKDVVFVMRRDSPAREMTFCLPPGSTAPASHC
jgi:hypothetical protein